MSMCMSLATIYRSATVVMGMGMGMGMRASGRSIVTPALSACSPLPSRVLGDVPSSSSSSVKRVCCAWSSSMCAFFSSSASAGFYPVLPPNDPLQPLSPNPKLARKTIEPRLSTSSSSSSSSRSSSAAAAASATSTDSPSDFWALNLTRPQALVSAFNDRIVSDGAECTSHWSRVSPQVDTARYPKHFTLEPPRRILMIGFGAIGQGVLPLLFRHIAMQPTQLRILTPVIDIAAEKYARSFGVDILRVGINRDNVKEIITKHVRGGDLVLNLSVDVSSVELIKHCAELDALYLDTCNEPWAGGYSDSTVSPSKRSNYAFREMALDMRKQGMQAGKSTSGATAVITHGANPGLVSHFVKAALLNLARDLGLKHSVPGSQSEWTALSMRLGIKAIHIAERDTQAGPVLKRENEFVNTWSIDGYMEEGKQPAELGWGSHEKEFPVDGRRHGYGCDAAIYLDRPGALTKVRTWTPQTGPFHSMLITHTEAVSIADYFTKRDSGGVEYRPTVHFAYHASNDAVQSMEEVAGKEWQRLAHERVQMDELTVGRDELGVLLMGHSRGAYWLGSNLTLSAARALAPRNNATSLQVCAGVLSGAIWALENPGRGIVEPEEMDFDRVLQIATPYLGNLVGVYSDWTPLNRRNLLFKENVDASDAWQFKNFRVT